MISRTRANFLPDPRFASIKSGLKDYLTKMGNAVLPGNFLSVCDMSLLGVLRESFDKIGADEGSIWLLDEGKKNLVIAYNSGPNADRIVGFKQPSNQGIVSLVIATEQAFVENQVYKNAKHSPRLDQKLRSTTYAMIAVPFYFVNQIRGVISCVQLVTVTANNQPAPDGKTARGFHPHDLPVIQTAAIILRDLIDYRLLATAVGWNGR
jgi:hypothetical protein